MEGAFGPLIVTAVGVCTTVIEAVTALETKPNSSVTVQDTSGVGAFREAAVKVYGTRNCFVVDEVLDSLLLGADTQAELEPAQKLHCTALEEVTMLSGSLTETVTVFGTPTAHSAGDPTVTEAIEAGVYTVTGNERLICSPVYNTVMVTVTVYVFALEYWISANDDCQLPVEILGEEVTPLPFDHKML